LVDCVSATPKAAFTVKPSAALLIVALGTTIFVVCPGAVSNRSESVAATETLKSPLAVSAVAPELSGQVFPPVGAGARLNPGLPAIVKAQVVSGAFPAVALALVTTGCGACGALPYVRPITPFKNGVAVVTANSGRTVIENACEAVLAGVAVSAACKVKDTVAGPAVVSVPVILQKLTAAVAGRSFDGAILSPAGSAPAMIVHPPAASVPVPPEAGIQIV